MKINRFYLFSGGDCGGTTPNLDINLDYKLHPFYFRQNLRSQIMCGSWSKFDGNLTDLKVR